MQRGENWRRIGWFNKLGFADIMVWQGGNSTDQGSIWLNLIYLDNLTKNYSIFNSIQAKCVIQQTKTCWHHGVTGKKSKDFSGNGRCEPEKYYTPLPPPQRNISQILSNQMTVTTEQRKREELKEILKLLFDGCQRLWCGFVFGCRLKCL